MSSSVVARKYVESDVGEAVVVEEITRNAHRQSEPPNTERVIEIPKGTNGVHRSIREFVKDLRNDVAYRRRFLLTLSAFWTYLAFAWSILQLGTALPDLQLLVNIDLDSASWLFTSRALGYIAGSPFIGILYDRFNRLVIMSFCVLCLAICVAALPFSSEFSVMLSLLVIAGVSFGGIETGVNTIVPSIWGRDGGPYMQALYLSYTIGGIIVPIATKPFMTPQHSRMNFEFVNATSITTDNYNGSFSSSENITQAMEISQNISVNEYEPIEIKANQIQYSFFISSVLVSLSSIPFIMMAVIGGFDIRDSFNPARSETAGNRPLERCSGIRKWVVILCMFGANSFLRTSLSSINNFVVTFCIGYLEWDNASSVTLLSFYWVASCIGSFIGIVIVRILRTSQLIFMANLAWIFTFLMTLMAGFYKIYILIWIFIPLSGLVMVIIMPAIISWTEKHVCDITGSVSAMLIITAGIGFSVNPRFIGYMMDNYSYMTFLYILFAESCVSFICYGVGLIGRYSFLTN